MEKRENKDGKLVRLAQSGDNDAMEQLCAEYKDTVRMLARPYFLIGADRDDLIQEGRPVQGHTGLPGGSQLKLCFLCGALHNPADTKCH